MEDNHDIAETLKEICIQCGFAVVVFNSYYDFLSQTGCLESTSQNYGSTLIIFDMIVRGVFGRHIIEDVIQSFNSFSLLFCSSYDCTYIAHQINSKYKNINTFVLQKPFDQPSFIHSLLHCFNSNQTLTRSIGQF